MPTPVDHHQKSFLHDLCTLQQPVRREGLVSSLCPWNALRRNSLYVYAVVTEFTARHGKYSWASFQVDNRDAVNSLGTTVWTSAQTNLSSLDVAEAELLAKTKLTWSYLGCSAFIPMHWKEDASSWLRKSTWDA